MLTAFVIERCRRHAIEARLLLVIALAACANVGNAVAAEVQAMTIRMVTSSDNVFARDTAVELQKLLEQTAPAMVLEKYDAALLPTSSMSPTRLVLTVGESAWKSVQASGMRETATLAIMPQHGAYENTTKRLSRNVSAIYLDQPVGRWLNLANLLKPNTPRLGVMLSPNTAALSQPLLLAASERKQRLRIETVEDEMNVGRTLAGIVHDIDLLLAIPDASVHTANTVQSILLMSYHAGIPVIGYSPGYQRAGAMVVLYTTPAQLAQQALELVTAFREGKALPAMQEAKYFSIGINATVAKSLGISLPDSQAIEQKLRVMKE